MGMRRWTTPRTVAPRFITYLTLFSVRIAIAYLILAARPTPMACGFARFCIQSCIQQCFVAARAARRGLSAMEEEPVTMEMVPVEEGVVARRQRHLLA